jgi:hypothetical protein
MASLTGQSIASSYEQLLHVDRDGGGNGTTHVSVKDGDNGTTFPITLATDAIMITSTNRLEFGDDASYIHQSADGVLDLVSDTEIELNATTIDINGVVDIDGATTIGVNDAVASSLGIGTTASITANTTKLQIGNHNTAVSAIYLTDNDAQDDWYIASNQTLAIGYNNSAKLSIAQDGTFTGSSSNDISDKELKENIKDVENGLETIKKLQGRTFTWKESAKMPEGTKYGLIAQELEKVLPDLVYDKSGIREKGEKGSREYYKSVQTTGIIPVLIEAVKELSAKVEALESE